MNISYIGELAAFGTALCWTFGSQFFEAAGKRVGTLSVNLIRLLLALLLFCTLSLFTKGNLFPVDFPMHAWIWLGLSGLIGFALGDLFLLKAFVEIGPRLSMLIMTLTAPISALLGLTFLGEIYSIQQWLGMLITLTGVSWVILERSNNNQNNKRKIRKIPKERNKRRRHSTIGNRGRRRNRGEGQSHGNCPSRSSWDRGLLWSLGSRVTYW